MPIRRGGACRLYCSQPAEGPPGNAFVFGELSSSLVTVRDSPTFVTIKLLQNVVSKHHHFLFQFKNLIKLKISSDWSTAAYLYLLMFVLVPGVEHGLT